MFGKSIQIRNCQFFQDADFQKTKRDFAFIIDKKFQSKELVEIIKKIDTNIIREVKVFDVYEGENVPDDKKSIALNITLQAFDKTLNEHDLEQLSQKIISTIKEKTGATIRS